MQKMTTYYTDIEFALANQPGQRIFVIFLGLVGVRIVIITLMQQCL